MTTVWDKLFGNAPAPANDSRALALRYAPGEESASAKPPSVIASLGALATGGDGRTSEATPKSLKVARTFDSIGRRNEALRTHLDAIEIGRAHV